MLALHLPWRFRSFPSASGAIVATVHDVLITVGLLALFGREFNLVVVAAFLTLVGYSVNDTVVVFDRIRENLRTPKKEPLESVINRSINQTLSRTMLTSGATMLVVVALFFLGGRGPEHVRPDADHRDHHRDLLLDLRRVPDRRDLEAVGHAPQARPGAPRPSRRPRRPRRRPPRRIRPR